jgi:hypothetical protein
MVITETTRLKLGLELGRTAPGTLADGTKSEYKFSGPIEIWWKDRSYICQALVVPNADENLLGAIPLEALDLMINLRTEELVGVHGDATSMLAQIVSQFAIPSKRTSLCA